VPTDTPASLLIPAPQVQPSPLLVVEVVEDTTARPSNLTAALAALVLTRAREHLRHGESTANAQTEPPCDR